MSTPNRQIGWSQESNLLSYISKQLDKLNGTVAATAAGGLLNPTTDRIPYNSGLAFGDSFLVNDATNSVLKTVYSASDVGLKLDFASNNYRFGDVTAGNGSYVEVDGWNIYLKGSNNNTWFEIDDNNSTIKSTYGGNDIGLKLDFANYEFYLGDYNGNNEYTHIYVDDNARTINLLTNGTKFFQGSNTLIELGDILSSGNGTLMAIDDANQRWEMSNNLTEVTAGASASKYLKVYIGGVTYKIALLNNA
jgi:hypothetical protein